MNTQAHSSPPTEVRTPNSVLTMEHDGIIRQTFTDQSLFDLLDAQETVHGVDVMVDGGIALLLVDMRGKFRITRQAREHFATEGFTDPNSVIAFLVNSRIGETFANLYLKINKPPYDAMVFHNEDDAKRWLHERKRVAIG